MTIQTLIAIAALTLAGAAQAQEATPDHWRDLQGAASRAEVRAARSGSLESQRLGYIESLTPRRSRAELKAEVDMARASGELAAINGEVYAFTQASPQRLARATR